MFGTHAGRLGNWYRQHFAALEDKHGPFDALGREYAAAVAAWWCRYRGDAAALEAAEHARATGRGRRPSARQIAALKKREGLSWGSYDAALHRLEAVTARRGAGTFADAHARLARQRA